MLRSGIAWILVVTLAGLSCPAFAGDLVSPKLLSPTPLFGLPQSGQTQAPAPQAASRPPRSKAGKVLTIVGVCVAGAGVGMVVAAPKETSIYSSGNSSVNLNWRYTGYAWIGIGGVLTTIGLVKLSK